VGLDVATKNFHGLAVYRDEIVTVKDAFVNNVEPTIVNAAVTPATEDQVLTVIGRRLSIEEQDVSRFFIRRRGLSPFLDV
jgi:hypothetical protein